MQRCRSLVALWTAADIQEVPAVKLALECPRFRQRWPHLLVTLLDESAHMYATELIIHHRDQTTSPLISAELCDSSGSLRSTAHIAITIDQKRRHGRV